MTHFINHSDHSDCFNYSNFASFEIPFDLEGSCSYVLSIFKTLQENATHVAMEACGIFNATPVTMTDTLGDIANRTVKVLCTSSDQATLAITEMANSTCNISAEVIQEQATCFARKIDESLCSEEVANDPQTNFFNKTHLLAAAIAVGFISTAACCLLSTTVREKITKPFKDCCFFGGSKNDKTIPLMPPEVQSDNDNPSDLGQYEPLPEQKTSLKK